jgi:hypothetical protein
MVITCSCEGLTPCYPLDQGITAAVSVDNVRNPLIREHLRLDAQMLGDTPVVMRKQDVEMRHGAWCIHLPFNLVV